jgi:hypothetical protein
MENQNISTICWSRTVQCDLRQVGSSRECDDSLRVCYDGGAIGKGGTGSILINGKATTGFIGSLPDFKTGTHRQAEVVL